MMNSTDAAPVAEAYVRTAREALAFLAGVFRRNLLLIAGLTALGAGIAAARWYSRAPYFESQLVCAYNNQRYPRKTFGEMTEKLNGLAQSGSAAGLARLLGISPQQAASIQAIEGRNKAGSPLHEDITEHYEAIYITLRAGDRQIFPAVERGLVAYLSGTPQQQLLGDLSVANLSTRIALLEGNVRKTDSVIDAYTVAIRSGMASRDTAAGRREVTEVLRYKHDLEEKLVGVMFKRELERGSSLVVMHGFAPADAPARGSRKPIGGGALLGCIVGCCWALLRNPNRQRTHV